MIPAVGRSPPEPVMAHRLAELHAECFDTPWDARAFAELLVQPGVFALLEAAGFILIRTVADEAEILTLAVRPPARKAGLGLSLVQRGAALAISQGARRLFLEVAEDNGAARALYARTGFAEAGRRPDYYARTDGSRVGALVLARDLSQPLP